MVKQLWASAIIKKLLTILCIVVLLAGGSVYAYRQWRLHSIPGAVWRCLRQPRQMTLYSIHPEEDASALVGAQLFHGYRILGQTPVSTLADQRHVAEAIERAVLNFPAPASCFNPRHALRVSDDRDTYDLVICYECGAMEVYVGDKYVGDTGFSGSPAALNSILVAGKVPLAEAQ